MANWLYGPNSIVMEWLWLKRNKLMPYNVANAILLPGIYPSNFTVSIQTALTDAATVTVTTCISPTSPIKLCACSSLPPASAIQSFRWLAVKSEPTFPSTSHLFLIPQSPHCHVYLRLRLCVCACVQVCLFKEYE